MTVDKRSSIYQRALIEHIPESSIRGTIWENILDSEEYTTTLQVANAYASAGNHQQHGSSNWVTSPFENLKKNKQTQIQRIAPKVLSLNESYFGSDSESSIEELWKSCHGELSKATKWDDASFLSILEKYTTTIPNPVHGQNDISWYDYTRVKAGMAVCIHDYLNHHNKEAISDDEQPILIIRADISGIKDYLGSIASTNASKNLKGRSFYIQLMGNAILRYTLNQLNLFQGNIIYDSGGNFFIIAPNIPSVDKAFQDIEKEVEAKLFHHHGIRLSIVMAAAELSQKDILNGDIDLAIGRLFDETISLKKKQKFSQYIKKNYKNLFCEIDQGGEIKTDVITGEEILKKEFYLDEDSPLPVRKETDEPVNIITAIQIFLGFHLKDLQYIIVSNEYFQDFKNDLQNAIEPCGLGIFYYLITSKNIGQFSSLINGLGNYSILEINGGSEDGSLKALVRRYEADISQPLHISSFLYGGNKAPLNAEERYKTFSEFAGEEKDPFIRLGVLKMDVDGLGSIFKHHIPYPEYSGRKDEEDEKRKHLSLPYYAALSRHLDWFFKGYLNTIWRNGPEKGTQEESVEDAERQSQLFKDNSQIIFSGGDDLFIVGKWDVIIAFSKEIQQAFSKFTGADSKSYQERTTLSGGISIVTHKYPVMKASQMASAAEDLAKQHDVLNIEDGKYDKLKNSVSLFGVPLHWDTEFKLVEELKDQLLEFLGNDANKDISKSLLSKIQMHTYDSKQFMRRSNYQGSEKIQWVWNVSYDLSRFANRLKKTNSRILNKLKHKLDDSNKELLKQHFKNQDATVKDIATSVYSNSWNNQPISSKYYFLELLSIAARWTELIIRTN